MRVLVTGGAGFIGSHVVAEALAAGFEVAVLDNFSTGKPSNVPSGVPIFEVDLRDREATFAALGDYAPELVCHQAAQASVPLSLKDPRSDAEVNLLGGINLLDACTRPGSRTRRVVFASTGGAIYGEVPEGVRASESFPPAPKSPYGMNKLTFERLLGMYGQHRSLSTSVLRYANVYGPRQDPHGEAGVVAAFFASALAGRTLTVFAKPAPGEGGCIRDYVYVGDVAKANLLALQGKLPDAVTNVASGSATTTEQLAGLVLSLTASTSRLERGKARVGDIERSLLDPTRLEQAIGLTTSLRAGLTETASWYGAR
jgi:UDP-glucose 4-epimerase